MDGLNSKNKNKNIEGGVHQNLCKSEIDMLAARRKD